MTRIVLSVLLGIMFAAAPCNLRAEITGSLGELENCAKLIDANDAAIKTWSGRAEISDETVKGDDKTTTTTVVDFLYKADGHQVRFSSTAVLVHKGVEQRIFDSGIKSRTEYFWLPAKTISDPRSAQLVDQLQREPAERFLAHAFSPQFDPTVFTKTGPRGTAAQLRDIQMNAAKFPGAGTVTSNGDLVTVTIGSDGRGPRMNDTFDKAHAGMPTSFESRPSSRTEVQYQVVDGIHLPSVVTIKRDSPRTGATTRKIAFRDSKLNAVVDDAEFTADKLPKTPRT
jgi:hypothetical protein